MNLEQAEKIAQAESEKLGGGIWVVWEDWSQGERIRVTPYDTFIEEATGADHAIRMYEDGEETR